MFMRCIVMFMLLGTSLLCAHVRSFMSPDLLKEEFNVCKYWYDGMAWDEFNVLKIPLEREGLIRYVDKIEQQKMALEVGLEIPKTYVATRDKIPLAGLLRTLENYVAKVTHLSWSDGLIIVKNGINMMTGEPITPEQVEEQLYESLNRKPRKGQPWALCHVTPGILIQEYIPHRMEIKMQTIFGKMMVGDYRGGETSAATTPLLGRFDREGNWVQGGLEDAPSWWPQAVEAAERMAHGTDSLRIDFLVREDGELLVNELEFYPEIYWNESTKARLAEAVSSGYRTIIASGS